MKKIAFASQGKEITAKLDDKFTRSPYFIIVTLKGEEIEVIENPAVKSLKGASEELTKFLFDKEVECVVSLNYNQSAYETLNDAEIDVLAGIKGTVRENLEEFKKGNLDLWFPYDINQRKGHIPFIPPPDIMAEPEIPLEERKGPPPPVEGVPPWDPRSAWGPPPPWEGNLKAEAPQWCSPPPWAETSEATRPYWGPPPPLGVPPEQPKHYWEVPPWKGQYEWSRPPWAGREDWGPPSWSRPPWWPEVRQGYPVPWMERGLVEEKIETLMETIETLADEVKILREKVAELEKKISK